MAGPALTVRVAAELAVAEQMLVATQSYEAASPAPTGLMVKDAEVAPPILTPFLRHWSVGAGEPAATTVNVTEAPGQAVWLVGWEVKEGGVLTVRVAALLVAL